MCFTNRALSQIAWELSTALKLPVSVIIDTTEELVVTATLRHDRPELMVSNLVAFVPGYAALQKKGSFIILPIVYAQTQKDPFSQHFKLMTITYRSYTKPNGQVGYWIDMSSGRNPLLNVALPPLRLPIAPKFAPLPHTRSFENTTLIDVLTIIATESGRPYRCKRLSESYVRDRLSQANQEPSWWYSYKAPAYAVEWQGEVSYRYD
jgi:hypothetical protein